MWLPHCKMSMALRSAAQTTAYQALVYAPGCTSEVDEVCALSLRGGGKVNVLVAIVNTSDGLKEGNKAKGGT